MATLGSRRGSSEKFALPLMVLAFVIGGGFLYWLSITAEGTEVAIVEAAEARSSGASAILALEDFLANPEGQIDAIVEVNGARIASRLGEQAFWVGSDDAPYLVKMGPDLVTGGVGILVESTVTIVGSVYMMSDSVLSAWDELGVFANDGDRIVAEFATSFLEARSIDGATGTEGAEADAGADEGTGN
jgi:hypothetical protein